MVKLKEKIIQYEKKLEDTSIKIAKLTESSDNLSNDVKELKLVVVELLECSKGFTDTLIALIREQLGD